MITQLKDYDLTAREIAQLVADGYTHIASSFDGGTLIYKTQFFVGPYTFYRKEPDVYPGKRYLGGDWQGSLRCLVEHYI